MAARITRAKKKLAASGVPYRIPLPQDLEQRLSDVLAVIYLVATEAHTPSHSEGFHHANHMELALTLSRIMTEHLPQHPEVLGLHALILFADARNQSRLDASGNVLRLDEMDRTLWDDGKIGEATSLTERAMQLATPETVGPYPLQAAIAAVHAEAPTFDETDWPQVVALYGMLEKVSPSPVVRLARSIAVSMRDGPDAGLAMIRAERLQEQLAGYPMLPAALADLHRRSGDCAEAETWYRRAAELTHNETMRDWFWSQAAIMREQAGS